MKESKSSLKSKKNQQKPNDAGDGQGQGAIGGQSMKGKKANFVPLFSQEGHAKDVILLPGRHPCLCEASMHSLISNCLNCGRIVCAQEGTGPCFTCGQPVYTKKEHEQFEADRRAKEEALKNLRQFEEGKQSEKSKSLKGIAASFQTAVAQKDRLIDYDRNSERRTKVIDDESDYYQLKSDHWMTEETRSLVSDKVDALQEAKFKKIRKLNIDIDTRTASEILEPMIKDIDSEKEKIEALTKFKSDYEIVDSKVLEESNIVIPTYCEQNFKYPESTDPTKKPADNPILDCTTNLYKNMRIQDSGHMEMTDDGICLTIQQPWASLIMWGIKLHEGRGWYSPFRGRLWIHSASRVPKNIEVNEAENFFRINHGITRFPDEYKAGYLLGCVSCVECLPIEEYRDKYPYGTSDSPYVFICEDPKTLKVQLPMKGGPKLFKLDKDIHKTALKALKL